MERLTVVLADDSAIARASLRRFLRRDFEVVGEASDGAEAVEIVEGLSPDAVIMDVTMRGVGGIEAARRLRDRGCGCAIVFLSVHRQDHIVREALSVSRCGYVTKRDAPLDLADAVRAVAGGAVFVSRSLNKPSLTPVDKPREGRQHA